jgi:hypothetical protein
MERNIWPVCVPRKAGKQIATRQGMIVGSGVLVVKSHSGGEENRKLKEDEEAEGSFKMRKEIN